MIWLMETLVCFCLQLGVNVILQWEELTFCAPEKAW